MNDWILLLAFLVVVATGAYAMFPQKARDELDDHEQPRETLETMSRKWSE